MSELVNLSRKAKVQQIARLREAVERSGVVTHKYLSFNAQRGDFYVREQDGESPVPVGTQLAVNWEHITHGFVCWKDGKPHDAVSWNLLAHTELPDITELPDHGPYTNDDNKKDGWREQITIPLKCIKTGVEYLFKTGPDSAVKSMRRFIADLRNELSLRLDADKSEDASGVGFPVVINAKGFFVPKGRTNRVFLPKFELVKEWVSEKDFSMMPVRSAGDGQFMLAMIEGDNVKSALINANVIDVVIDE